MRFFKTDKILKILPLSFLQSSFLLPYTKSKSLFKFEKEIIFYFPYGLKRFQKTFISTKNLRSIYLDNPIKTHAYAYKLTRWAVLGVSIQFRDLRVYPDLINFSGRAGALNGAMPLVRIGKIY